MRSLKKPIFLLAAIALIVSVGVYATVAYLVDVAEVTNTFTMGNVNITLDEAVVDPDTGDPIGDDRTFEGGTYHLVPGRSFTKDPTVSIAQGSEDCFVRMVVSVNNATAMKNLFGEDGFLNFTNYKDKGEGIDYGQEFWILKSISTAAGDPETLIYEFRYHAPVIGWTGRLEPLFTSIKVPGEVTGSQLASLTDLKIVIQAHAIQFEGFGNNADLAWNAFGDQGTNDPIIIMPPATPIQTVSEESVNS